MLLLLLDLNLLLNNGRRRDGRASPTAPFLHFRCLPFQFLRVRHELHAVAIRHAQRQAPGPPGQIAQFLR